MHELFNLHVEQFSREYICWRPPEDLTTSVKGHWMDFNRVSSRGQRPYLEELLTEAVQKRDVIRRRHPLM